MPVLALPMLFWLAYRGHLRVDSARGARKPYGSRTCFKPTKVLALEGYIASVSAALSPAVLVQPQMGREAPLGRRLGRRGQGEPRGSLTYRPSRCRTQRRSPKERWPHSY